MTRHSESGGAVVFTVVFVAFIVFGVLLVVAVSSDGISGTSAVVAAVSGLVVVVGLVREARRDLDAVLVFGIALLALVALPAGIYAAVSEPREPLWIAVAAIATVGAVWLGVVTFRRQRAPEDPAFPNVLARLFPAAQIFEREGMQFAGALKPAEGPVPQRICLYLQNCLDRARTVTIDFDAGSRAKYLRFHKRAEVPLGPAEVAKVELPVISPHYDGTYALYFTVSAKPAGGRRVRLWRAQEATRKISGTETALLLTVGHLAFGGGVRFTIRPSEEALWQAPLAAPTIESVWRPAFGTIESHSLSPV